MKPHLDGGISSRMGSIVDAFDRHVAERAEACAVWSRGEGLRLSFASVAERVEALARSLSTVEGGRLRAGPAAIATGNGAAFPELFLALRRLGVPVVSLDGDATLAERVEACRRLGVPTLVHRSSLRDAGELAPERPGAALGEGLHCLTLDDVEPAPVPRDTALVKLTSGCTGQPEGVCFTEAALLAGIGQIAAGMEIRAEDRVLIAIPLSHSYGFDNGVLSLAVVGTPLVIEPDFFPRSILRALVEGEISFFPTVPPLVRSLAGSEWPDGLSLRRVICAAGPLTIDDAEAFRRASSRSVHQFYGCTESGGITFETEPGGATAAGTVGHPLPGVRVTLDDGGRVLVDSPACFHGRLGVEEPATGPRTVTPGDIGEWQDDGRLRLTGRCADFLKIGGRKVHASTIEAALLALETVEAAAVIGLADPARGDRVIAFVVSGAEIDPRRLPPELAPREVRRVDALPFTARGKLDRESLRRLARSML